MKKSVQIFCLFSCLMLVLFGFQKSSFAETSVKETPATQLQQKPMTGIIELEGTHDPVFVYVPDSYTGERSYSLIISFADEGIHPKEHLKEWADAAQRFSLIILSPDLTGLRTAEDKSRYHDQWILELKNKVMMTYKISKRKVFIVGYGARANYAAYLGMKYPAQFSAVAMLDGSWNGPFESLMKIQKNVRKQVPFYVALRGANSSLTQPVDEMAQRLQSAGYMVAVEHLNEQESFSSSEFMRKLHGWLNEKSDRWQDHVAQSQQSWKDRFKSAVEENIVIRN